jgi:hypothetical protein
LKVGQICAFGSRIREEMMDDDGLWILRKKKIHRSQDKWRKNRATKKLDNIKDK